MKDSVQEQLIAARRSQILDAAVKVFARKGFHPATIRDIAKEAGIADGTIYNYFENKTALIIAVFDRMNETDQREEDLSKFTEGDFRSAVQAYFEHRLTVLKVDNFEVFRVIISETMVNQELRQLYFQKILEPTFAMAQQSFQYWADQGLIRQMDFALLMRLIVAMIIGMIFEQIMGDTLLEEKWDELPELITSMLLNGIGV